jgi:hypothetical protein
MILMADTTTTPAPRSPRQIADDYLDALVAHNPGVAASMGLNLDDHRQPDLSPRGFDAEDALRRRALADLAEAVNTDDLAEAACARLLKERLTAQTAVHDAGDHFRSLNNLASPLHEVRAVFTIMPTSPRRWRSA